MSHTAASAPASAAPPDAPSRGGASRQHGYHVAKADRPRRRRARVRRGCRRSDRRRELMHSVRPHGDDRSRQQRRHSPNEEHDEDPTSRRHLREHQGQYQLGFGGRQRQRPARNPITLVPSPSPRQHEPQQDGDRNTSVQYPSKHGPERRGRQPQEYPLGISPALPDRLEDKQNDRHKGRLDQTVQRVHPLGGPFPPRQHGEGQSHERRVDIGRFVAVVGVWRGLIVKCVAESLVEDRPGRDEGTQVSGLRRPPPPEAVDPHARIHQDHTSVQAGQYE